jgi:hypothetical protein
MLRRRHHVLRTGDSPRAPAAVQELFPSLSLVPPATNGSSWQTTDAETHELTLTFRELTLIYKSLQAVKTLGRLPSQDELLDDTIELVDRALDDAL